MRASGSRSSIGWAAHITAISYHPRGANNIAIALFSFPSLAAYEDYRTRMASDLECQAAFDLDKRNRSIISYERSFMRPVLG